jgi:outer membrane protein
VRSEQGKKLRAAVALLVAVSLPTSHFPLLTSRLCAAEDWKSEKGGGEIVVETVNVQTTGKYTKVILQSSAPLKYREIEQTNPPGLFLYMDAPTVSKRPPIQKIYGDLVEEVRFGYKGAGVGAGEQTLPLDYILFKVTEPASYKIVQKDWVLVVELQPRGGKAAARAAAQPDADAYVPEAPSRKSQQKLAVLPSSPGLQDFLDVGLANHEPLRIAEKEYGLAKFRFFEASRALFPSVSGRYTQSDGTLLLDPTDQEDDTDFRRKEIGLQLGQPIWQSGRLYYSLRQASMQKRISAQNLKKTRADAAFEIKKAYYNLVKAQRALKVRKEISDRAEKTLELTRKKKQLEVVTEAEALGVESQYSQIYYRMLSDEKDLQIAQLRMQALLNTPEPVPAPLPEPEPLDFKALVTLNTTPDALVAQAMSHRPEMVSADYTARFQRYGEKVAKAEGRLRVDVSGFIGKSGGAFEAEDLQLRSSWNVGVQAGMYFAGNSLRGTGTKEKTSPDLGETSRTGTNAQTANVGVLDGLKVISDRRQATINKDRAMMELDQSRRNVDVEVREAFFNLEKAKLQLKGGQQEYDYRQKELTIARQKERMNLIEPTQALSAESSFAEASVSLEEAVAFYQVSLAQLEKAVGLPLESLTQTP